MHLRPIILAFAVLALVIPVSGMSKKQAITVRIHMETNSRDGDTFAMPVKLRYQRRDAYIDRTAMFSEHQILAIFPYPAGDGTWGCVFKLTSQGRIRLETLSGETRGTALVVFVGTEKGQHQVVDMVVDRPVSDGIITVPRGLTDSEVAALKTQFKVIGADQGKKKKKPEKRDEDGDLMVDRPREPATKPAQVQPSAVRSRSGPEPDLPRLAD